MMVLVAVVMVVVAIVVMDVAELLECFAGLSTR